MDTAQWPHQEILMKPMEEILPKTCSSSVTTTPNIIPNSDNDSKPSSNSLERKVKPEKDQSLNCPRCNSTNTKFCYYNNYSLTQPRYFCKSCRRYWTQGGSLRNIPVGGGSRKNKRSSSSSLSPSNDALAIKNPKIIHQGQDLNLGFNPNHQEEFRNLTEFMQLPTIESTQKGQIHHHLSGLELLNGLTSSTRGLTPLMPMSVPEHGNGVYSSGLLFPPLQDYKPSLSFSLVDGLGGNGYGDLEGNNVDEHRASVADERNSGRLLFPFEDLKQVSSSTSADHHNNSADNDNHNNNNHEKNGDQGDSTTGYWTGMLGSGGSW